MSVSDFIYCRTFSMIPQRPINCENVKEMSNPTRDGRAMIAAGMSPSALFASRTDRRVQAVHAKRKVAGLDDFYATL